MALERAPRGRVSVLLVVLLGALLGSRRVDAQRFDCLELDDRDTNLVVPPSACLATEDWCNCVSSRFSHPVRGAVSGFRQAIYWVLGQPGIGNERVLVDAGDLDLATVQIGDVIGRADAHELVPLILRLFLPGCACEFFTVRAELRVTDVDDGSLEFHAIITEVTDAVVRSLGYDPTDADHADGHFLTGTLASRGENAGFVLEYRYAVEHLEEDPPRHPGLEADEVAGPPFTVPLLVEFFSRESGVFTLPDAEDVLVATTLRGFEADSPETVLAIGAPDLCADLELFARCRSIEEILPLFVTLEPTPVIAEIVPIDAFELLALEEPVLLRTSCGRADLILRGRNSRDGGQDVLPLEYEWFLSEGDPEAVELQAAALRSRDAHVTFRAAGEFRIGLRVTSGPEPMQRDVAFLDLDVTHEGDSNSPPEIVVRTDPASAEIALVDGVALLRLDGSDSNSGADRCEQPLEFRWRAVDGPGNVEFSTPDEPSTEARFRAPGTYAIELRVDDGGFEDSSDLEEIEVRVLGVGAEPEFRRGDANDDRNVDLADPIATLNWLFLAAPPPTCQDAADADDDGTPTLTDAILVLQYLFLGGATPPAPGIACGADPSRDELPICRFTSCG